MRKRISSAATVFENLKSHSSFENFRESGLSANERLRFVTDSLERKNPISRMDVDEVFKSIDRISPENFKFIHQMIKLFQQTHEGKNYLRASPLNLTIGLLRAEKFELLYQILSDKLHCRILPDDPAYTLILSHCLAKNEYEYGWLFSSELMLQDTLECCENNVLSMKNLAQYLTGNIDKLLIKQDHSALFTSEEELENDDEFGNAPEVKINYIRVTYIRPKMHDSHFLIEDRKNLFGKTLAHFAGAKEFLDEIFAQNCRIIGNCFYENFDEAFKSIVEFKNNYKEFKLYNFTKILIMKSLDCLTPLDELPKDYAGKKLFNKAEIDDLRLKFESVLNSNDSLDVDEKSAIIKFEESSKNFFAKQSLPDFNKLLNYFTNELKLSAECAKKIQETVGAEKQLEEKKFYLLSKLREIERIEMLRKFAEGDEKMHVAYLKSPEVIEPFPAEKEQAFLAEKEKLHGKVERPLQT